MIKNLLAHDLTESNSLLLKLIYLLSLALPLTLLSGPFLPDLILSLIALFYLFFISKKDFKNIKVLKISKIFLVIFLILFTSILFSDDQRALKVLFIFRFFFYFFSILILINNFKNYIKVFSSFLKIIIFIFILDIFFQFVFGYNILGLEPLSRGSGDFFAYTSFFADEKIAGSFLVRLLPLLIFFYLINDFDTKYQNFKIFALLIIFVLSSFLSGERTAFANAILIAFLVNIYLIKINKKNIIFVFILLLLPTLIYSLNINQSKKIVNDTINQIGLGINDKKILFFSSTHERYARVSLEIFLENKILGVGPKGFKKECIKKYNVEKCNTHPHNIFFQVISELGILGALLYIGLLFSIIAQVLNCIMKNNPEFLIYLNIFILLNPFLPSGSLFNNWLLIIHFISLPYLYVKNYR